MTEQQIDRLTADIWDDFQYAIPDSARDHINERTCPDYIRDRIKQALKEQ